MVEKSMSYMVLIVDDNADILKMISRILEMDGYRVVTASTGHAGIEAAQSPEVAAVLLDLGLPDLDGLEVLNEIKKIRPRLPVIMVTGNNDEEKAQKAVALGAWDYITKPIDIVYLKNVVGLSMPR